MAGIESIDPMDDHLQGKKKTLAAAVGRGIEATALVPQTIPAVAAPVAALNAGIESGVPAAKPLAAQQGIEAPVPANPGGSIPGAVTPGGGDNILTPTQTGEYITPVDAMIAKGREIAQNPQLDPEAAMSIAKGHMDDETTRLKQSMGNMMPPNNAGIEGFAEGGFVRRGTMFTPMQQGITAPYGHPGIPMSQVNQPQAGANFPVAGADFPVAGTNFPVAGANFPVAGSDFPVAGANFPVAGADFPKAGAGRGRTGYAEGGAVATPWAYDPKKIDSMRVPLPVDGGIMAQPNGAPAPGSPPPVGQGIEAPVSATQAASQPAPPVGQSLTAPSAATMPVHPKAATADPHKILFNASKGIDGTGIMRPVTTVTNGNLAEGIGNKDSKGVIANGTNGNNLGDTASIVQGITAGGSTTDIGHGITGPGQSPMLEMRGSLDPATAKAIHNRVDFSAGSVNDPASTARYTDEVQKAMRVNAANGIMPSASQMKTAGMSITDEVGLLSANNRNGQFTKGIESMQTQQASDAKTAMVENEGITAMSGRIKAEAEARLDDAKAKTLSSGFGKLAEVKGKVTVDGKPILRNEHGQRFTLDESNIPVPYLGKELGEVKPLTAHQQWTQDQVQKKSDLASKSTADLAAMLVSGDVAPSELSDRAGQRASAMIAAKKLDPNFSAQKADVNYGLKKNAAFRTKELTAEVLPEIMRNVVAAGKKVNFSGTRFTGNIEKWAKGQMNDPAFTEYMVQRNDAVMTIGSVMRGNGMTDMAHRVEDEAFHPTLDPKALDAWLDGQMKSLTPRLQQYQNLGMKPKIIDPKTGLPTDQPVEQGMVVDPATGRVIVSREDIPSKLTGQSLTGPIQPQMWKKPGTNSVPMGAVDMLKANPTAEMKAHFDEKYGAGYAALALKG